MFEYEAVAHICTDIVTDDVSFVTDDGVMFLSDKLVRYVTWLDYTIQLLLDLFRSALILMDWVDPS